MIQPILSKSTGSSTSLFVLYDFYAKTIVPDSGDKHTRLPTHYTDKFGPTLLLANTLAMFVLFNHARGPTTLSLPA